ncbi:MAG: pilus assembly protein [Pseudorhodobacter sp.]|nr:pilus assembly protein [Pseudorhodobacter sp.]
MKLQNTFKAFASDESGAVTVDWVVLTAAIVGLGIVVMTTVGGGIETLSGKIVTNLNDTSAGYVSQAK